VARCATVVGGLRSGGPRSLAEREVRGQHTDGREGLMTARDETSSDHQPIEFGRNQGPVRYFVDICRRRNVVVEGTVLRRRAMDIDRISSDSDDIIENPHYHEVI